MQEGLLASFKSSHRGMDPLGALHHAFLAVATDMAGSERGTYVLQKLAQHCDPEEVREEGVGWEGRADRSKMDSFIHPK